MIEASFHSTQNHSAAVSGAYQYDTGQRLRMHGLPSPDELSGRDDFLSGDIVSVQAQYGYEGDTQTEARIALYDEETGTWVAEIPDVYMTRRTPVHVYVYVGYGSDEDSSRAKTLYEAVFTPIGRPAPGDQVTPDQINAWDALVGEINLTLAKMNTATSETNAATTVAIEAAKTASEAAQEATEQANAAYEAATAADAAREEIVSKWENAKTEATTLAPGSEVTADISDTGDAYKLSFGIPKGEKGEKGDTGPAGVTFRLEGTTLYITTDK